jgi:hypothetical protein
VCNAIQHNCRLVAGVVLACMLLPEWEKASNLDSAHLQSDLMVDGQLIWVIRQHVCVINIILVII